MTKICSKCIIDFVVVNLQLIGKEVDNLKMNLRALRVNANMKQIDVAKALGVNRATIHNWENSKTSPTASQLLRLCDLYDCEVGDIFFPDKLTLS